MVEGTRSGWIILMRFAADILQHPLHRKRVVAAAAAAESARKQGQRIGERRRKQVFKFV